ncbi:MAG: hypothetical protein ACRCX2_04815 [Paraclostridium sp.]
MSSSVGLLANAQGRLFESLALNQLLATTPQNVYVCSLGAGTTTPTQISVLDLIAAKGLLERGKVKRLQGRMMKPSALGIGGTGHLYGLLCSIQSKLSVEQVMTTNKEHLVRPEQMIHIEDYKDQLVFVITTASIAVLYSTEYQTSSSASYKDLIIGGDSIFIASPGTGMKSRITYRPSSLYPMARHSCIDLLCVFGMAVIASRIVSISHAAYSKAP